MFNKLFGIVLVALGVLALIYGGIKYTSREKVIEVGPLQATAETEKEIAVPPAVGAALIGGGVLSLLLGGRRKK